MKYQTLLLVALFLVSACASEQAPSTEAPDAAAESAETYPTEVVISPVGGQLKYATEAFTVKSGTTVTLIMDNVATLEAMQHNVVILAAGADVNAVGLASIQAGPDNGYIPADPAVLFHTPMAKPGEKVQIEFTAPEPGEYPFICTFPGHYGVMKGVMTVVA